MGPSYVVNEFDVNASVSRHRDVKRRVSPHRMPVLEGDEAVAIAVRAILATARVRYRRRDPFVNRVQLVFGVSAPEMISSVFERMAGRFEVFQRVPLRNPAGSGASRFSR